MLNYNSLDTLALYGYRNVTSGGGGQFFPPFLRGGGGYKKFFERTAAIPLLGHSVGKQNLRYNAPPTSDFEDAPRRGFFRVDVSSAPPRPHI